MNGVERESTQLQERTALNGNAQGDERVVHNGATVAVSTVLVRAGYFKVFELFESRDGADEGWNVGGSMEKGWVLFNEEVGDLPASIRSSAKTRSRGVLSGRTVRGILKGNLITHIVNERRQECLGPMAHFEAKGLNVRTNPLERCYTSGLSKGAGSERDRDLFEEVRRRANPKVMACKSQRCKVFLGKAGKEVVTGLPRPPEVEKRGFWLRSRRWSWRKYVWWKRWWLGIRCRWKSMHCAETGWLPRRLTFDANGGRAFDNSESDMAINSDLSRGDRSFEDESIGMNRTMESREHTGGLVQIKLASVLALTKVVR